MSKLIYLSPSNHGKGQNKCLVTGCYEDKHTRPIAEACAKYLKKAGFTTIIGKPSQNMAARCEEADEKGADLYVPIHTNASSSESARYLLFMFYQDNATYRKLFDAVAPCLEAIYPGNEKAHFSARTDLYEIKAPSAKTLYCELGFHTNNTDVDDFIHNPEKVGKALAEGICNYFGIKIETEKPAEETTEKTISQIADEVIAGKWGNGADRKKKLEAAGYNYNEVQAEVNKKLGASATKPVTLSRGSSVKLKNCPLYGSSTTEKSSGKVSGTYFLWDGKLVNDRYRITNSKNRVGVAGQVTGWIDKKDI